MKDLLEKYLKLNLSTMEVLDNLLVEFGLILYVPVNSYGHVKTVSSPKHIFPGQA